MNQQTIAIVGCIIFLKKNLNLNIEDDIIKNIYIQILND